MAKLKKPLHDFSIVVSGKSQGYKSRLDESLGMRRGKESTKTQSLASRRRESEGMERSMGRRPFAAVGTMDVGDKSVKKELKQTGKPGNKVRDASRGAKLPGKRTTQWGTVYWETRRNRSDARGSDL